MFDDKAVEIEELTYIIKQVRQYVVFEYNITAVCTNLHMYVGSTLSTKYREMGREMQNKTKPFFLAFPHWGALPFPTPRKLEIIPFILSLTTDFLNPSLTD